MRRFVVLAPLLVACGPNFISDDLPSDASIFFDATTDVGSPFPEDATIEAEAATVFNGGGPFACFGCVCDGTRDTCSYNTGRGHAPLDDDASAPDANACVPDASACVPIPLHCLPKPSCACIMLDASSNCACSVDPSGNGLVVACFQ